MISAPVPTVTITCPEGAVPGGTLMVQDPSTGQQVQVVVPEGIMPGQNFEVHMPASVQAKPQAPVPMAQTVVQTAQPVAAPVVSPQQVIVQQAAPQVVILQGTTGMQHAKGDRLTVQKGCTRLTQPNTIGVSSWEVKDVGVCDKITLLLRCSVSDVSRSYIYIRNNNSLELNDTNGIRNCCTCCCEIPDDVRVEYFDRPPWAPECNCAPFPYCCCIYNSRPKLEVVDLGCMCCCVHIDPCCCGKKVVIMPFEMMPPPCCCCSNRVGWCDNYCGLCGPVSGNPKIFGLFAPQPKDAVLFVGAAQQAMMSGGGVESEEMER
mmetsp:Transcript_49959/g.130112  ORF Transcript_49959/g.130112 Transcript_49959/m.130112 type:complete len:319 (-) Transcript_49959:710-1666(-)